MYFLIDSIYLFIELIAGRSKLVLFKPQSGCTVVVHFSKNTSMNSVKSNKNFVPGGTLT